MTVVDQLKRLGKMRASYGATVYMESLMASVSWRFPVPIIWYLGCPALSFISGTPWAWVNYFSSLNCSSISSCINHKSWNSPMIALTRPRRFAASHWCRARPDCLCCHHDNCHASDVYGCTARPPPRLRQAFQPFNEVHLHNYKTVLALYCNIHYRNHQASFQLNPWSSLYKIGGGDRLTTV